MDSTTLTVLADIKAGLERIERLLCDRAPPPSPMMTEQEVSQMLGVKRQTLGLWRSQGRPPAYVKVGNRVRYKREDVQQFIDNRTQGN